MKLKTLQSAGLKGKKVLLRADLNVPLNNGTVTDTTRIDAIKPTIDYLTQQGAMIYIASHLGRPEGEKNPEFSLEQIITTMEKCLGIKVIFTGDCVQCPEIQEGEVVLLENTRFYPEEEENEVEFAKKFASNFDIFVNDAFGAAHRAHVSTVGVTEFLPSYAGYLMQKEVEALSPLLSAKNVTLVLGGSKIDTKIGVIKNFLDKSKAILIGGALANTFLEARGHDIGKSKSESGKIELAQEIMLTAEKLGVEINLPTDVIIADEIGPDVPTLDAPIEDVELNMMILDIGKFSSEKYISKINDGDTIIMNGPVGLYEMAPFQQGTRTILEAISNHNGTTILGGGDTIDAINNFGIPEEKFSHVSTGGGAMLEFLEGKMLPGIEPLLAKS